MENMVTKQLLFILKEYCQNNRLVDIEFYRRVYDVLKTNFEDYVNELIIISEEDVENPNLKRYTEGFAGIFGQACYDEMHNKLVIYDRNIRYAKKRELQALNVNDSNYVLLYNILILQTILHEFEHIKQKKEIEQGNGIESHLLRLTESGDKVETTFSYEFSLKERLAEIRSFEQLINIVNSLNINNLDVINYLKNQLFSKYKAGYGYRSEKVYYIEDENGIFMSPTELYIKLRNCNINEFKRLIQLIPPQQRILFGMPMTTDEYEQIFDSDLLDVNKSLR